MTPPSPASQSAYEDGRKENKLRPPSPAASPREPERGLPKGLWAGTAVFAILSAAALFAILRLGQRSFEGESVPRKQAERPAFLPPRAGAEKEPEAPQGGVSAEDKKTANKHFNQGIAAFQKGDWAKAREDWLLCRQFDPSNSDCAAGLQRIDRTHGGGR
jgi:hypothetical protein